MQWKTLINIYESVIGKALILISLSSPVSLLIKTVSYFSYSFFIALIGAVFIIAGYIITVSFCPDLIRTFKTHYSYTDYLFKLKESTSITHEFFVLKDKVLDKYVDQSVVSPANATFDKISAQFNGTAWVILASTKFEYFSKSKRWLRMFLTFLFYLGVVCISVPVVSNLLFIFKEGVNV